MLRRPLVPSSLRRWFGTVSLLTAQAVISSGCTVFANIGMMCSPGSTNAEGCTCSPSYAWECPSSDGNAGEGGGDSTLPTGGDSAGGDASGHGSNCLNGTALVMQTLNGVSSTRKMSVGGAVWLGYRYAQSSEEFALRWHRGQQNLRNLAVEAEGAEFNGDATAMAEALSEWPTRLAELKKLCAVTKDGLPILTDSGKFQLSVELPDACSDDPSRGKPIIALEDSFPDMDAKVCVDAAFTSNALATQTGRQAVMKAVDANTHQVQRWAQNPFLFDIALRRATGFYTPLLSRWNIPPEMATERKHYGAAAFYRNALDQLQPFGNMIAGSLSMREAVLSDLAILESFLISLAGFADPAALAEDPTGYQWAKTGAEGYIGVLTHYADEFQIGFRESDLLHPITSNWSHSYSIEIETSSKVWSMLTIDSFPTDAQALGLNALPVADYDTATSILALLPTIASEFELRWNYFEGIGKQRLVWPQAPA